MRWTKCDRTSSGYPRIGIEQTAPRRKLLQAGALQICSSQIQQGVVPQAAGVALAKLRHLNDAQRKEFPRGLGVSAAYECSAAVLNRLPRLIEGVNQNADLVSVEGAAGRVFFQKL